MKRVLRTWLLFVTVFSWFAFNAYGQTPFNDDCSQASATGTVTAPACPSPADAGTPQVFGGGLFFPTRSNVNATAEGRIGLQTACNASGTGNTVEGAGDVWYHINTGNNTTILRITVSSLTGGFTSPNISLWEGSNCNNLIGRGCVSATGPVVGTFTGLQPNTNYKFRIAGASATDRGGFNFTIEAGRECESCSKSVVLTASPLPVNGSYTPGQVIRFTATVTGWDKQGSDNWFSGLELKDLASSWAGVTNTSLPTSCDGVGSWAYYPNGFCPGGGTSCSAATKFGPGFYYDSRMPNPVASPLDNDPGNNKGDGASTADPSYASYGGTAATACGNGISTVNVWTFSWDMTVGPCPPSVTGSNLSFKLNSIADREARGLSCTCDDDGVLTFATNVLCCSAPIVVADGTCTGLSRGQAAVTPGNLAATPFSYELINSSNAVVRTQTGEAGAYTFTNLAAGNYTVRVVDNNNCTATSASFTIASTTNSAISVSGAQTLPTCSYSSNGSILASATGSRAPYIFLWANATTSATLTGLASGTQNITVSDDRGCILATTLSLAAVPAIGITVTQNNGVSCFNQCNARLTATTSNVTTPSFLWSNAQTTSSISGLCANSYFLTVTGSNGCTATSAAATTITNPAQLVANAGTSSSVALNSTVTLGASPVVTGGTAPFSYIWTGGLTAQNPTVTVTVLGVNTYCVTVTDANGCTATSCVNILCCNPPTVVADATCTGLSRGQAIVTPSNIAATPFSYELRDAINAVVSTQNAVAGAFTFTNLAAGAYTVKVSDNNGCTALTGFTITTATNSAISVSGAQTLPTCSYSSNGSILASATGSRAPYNFLWANATTSATLTGIASGTQNITVSDDRGCILTTTLSLAAVPAIGITVTQNNGVSCFNQCNARLTATTSNVTTPSFLWSNAQTTSSISGLCANSYFLTVTGSNGCTATSAAATTITNPAQLVADAGASSNVGLNTTVTLGGTNTASGGTAPYTYNWSNAATSTNPTVTISTLGLTSFCVTVTDANACSAVSCVNKVVNCNDLYVTNSLITNEDCGFKNGSIKLTIGTGTGTFTYNWSNGATDAAITGLQAGVYKVTVSNGTGCTVAGSYVVGSSAQLFLNVTTIPSNCGGSTGSATATVSGSSGITFRWSNGQTTSTITGLASGSYTVSAVNSLGCIDFEEAVVGSVVQYTANANVTATSACGIADGQVQIVIAGTATSPISFRWSDNVTTSIATRTGLAAGPYTAIVVDANQCAQTATFSVGSGTTPGSGITVTSVSHETCRGANNGGVITNVAYAGSNTPISVVIRDVYGIAYTNNQLPAGRYFAQLEDVNKCVVSSAPFIVNPGQALIVSASTTNPSCNGSSNGVLSIENILPAGAFTFNVNGTNVSNPLVGLGPGTYAYSVTQGTCIVTGTAAFTNPSPLSTTLTQTTNIICGGNCNGAVSVTPSDGLNNALITYSFNWNSGQTASSITGLCAGVYQLTATSSLGCSNVNSITLTAPPVVSVTAGTSQILPLGTSVTLGGSPTASGGTGAFTYNWSTGDNVANPAFTSTTIAVQTVCVTATDAVGCTASNCITLDKGCQNLFVTGAVIKNENCGFDDGSIELTVGQTANTYNYTWSNGASTRVITALSSGRYSVTITEPNSICSQTATYVVNSSESIITSITKQNAVCGSTRGSATVNINLGIANATFTWSNGSSAQTTTGLNAGTYGVTVTNMATSCTDIMDVVIVESANFSATVTSLTGASSCGASDGSAQVSTVGTAVAPLQFIWSDGFTTTNAVLRTGLPSGAYNVIVIDNGGCRDTVNFAINGSGTSTASVTVNTLTHETCQGASNGRATFNTFYNGNATPTVVRVVDLAGNIRVNGQLPPGRYLANLVDATGCVVTSTNFEILAGPSLVIESSSGWPVCNAAANGTFVVTSILPAGYSPVMTFNSAPFNGSIATLTAGTYLFTASAGSCVLGSTITLSDPPVMNATLTEVSAITCNGYCSGALSISVAGGVTTTASSYTFNWSNGNTTAAISSLCANAYSVTATDLNGCQISRSKTLISPTRFNLSRQVLGISCFGRCDGEVDMSVSGAIAPYTYRWISGETTQDLLKMCAGGGFIVTITDAIGCDTTLQVNVPAGVRIVVTIDSIKPLTCPDSETASIFASATGGRFNNFLYSWNLGDYITEDITNVGDGTYRLVVTDQDGCTATNSTTINNIPGMFTAQTVTLPTCNKANGAANGSIQLQTIDGNVPAPPATYTYVWSANARGQTTATVTGLSGGASNAEQYTYIVTDAKGCTATGDVYMSEPTEMGVTLTQLSQPLCSYSSEGSISYRARGGNGFDYTYRWSNAQTTTTTSAAQIGIITGLPAGNFFCTVTDPRGCSLTDSKQILAPEPVDPPTVAATDITCQGKLDGRATGDAFGGTAPHTFVWSTGVTNVIPAGQISTISGLASGPYSVTVTDANGCTSTPTNFSINDGLLFQIRSITSSTIPCKGDQTGEATIRSYVNGIPAIIQWSNGFFGNPVSGLSVGTYNVTVTSVAGCTTTGSVEIKETGTALDPPVTKAESVRCYGERNGKLEIDNNQSYGGTPPYQYSFTDNAYSTRDTLLNNISAGYYTVYIRDALGCKNQVNAYVPGPEKMDVAIDPTSARINLGDSILLRTVLNFSTTSTPLTYGWSSYGLRDSIRCNTCANTYANPIEFRTYTVTVTDSKGCSTTKSVDVDVNTERNVYIPTGFTPNGDKVNDVFYVQTGAGLKAQKAIRFGRIYDRWGGLVFEIENVDSNNELFGWKGTIKGQDAPSTTYVYVFEIEFLDGTVKLYKGNINLIR